MSIQSPCYLYGIWLRPKKHSGNIAADNVDFTDILGCFVDEIKVVRVDDRYEYGEVRYNMLAELDGRIYHITFTERDEVTWLISAEKLTNGSNGAMQKQTLKEVRAVFVDGKPYQKHPDGSLTPLRGKTNWKKLDAMSDVAVTAAAEADPDARSFTDDEWAAAEVVTPSKKVVTLRLDQDVLAFQVEGSRVSIPHQCDFAGEKTHKKAG